MNSLFKIGITGHQLLPPKHLEDITESIGEFYNEVHKKHKDIVVLSSLAEGADMLCASIALEMGFQLVAPLPFDELEYSKNYYGDDIYEFDWLCKAAEEVFTVIPFEEVPDDPQRGFYYRQAGIYVAKN